MYLTPENRLDKSSTKTGLFTLEAAEASAQVTDVELDLCVYADGSITLDNRQGHDEGNYVKLSPSQVQQLRAVLNSDHVPKKTSR